MRIPFLLATLCVGAALPAAAQNSAPPPGRQRHPAAPRHRLPGTIRSRSTPATSRVRSSRCARRSRSMLREPALLLPQWLPGITGPMVNRKIAGLEVFANGQKTPGRATGRCLRLSHHVPAARRGGGAVRLLSPTAPNKAGSSSPRKLSTSSLGGLALPCWLSRPAHPVSPRWCCPQDGRRHRASPAVSSRPTSPHYLRPVSYETAGFVGVRGQIFRRVRSGTSLPNSFAHSQKELTPPRMCSPATA